MGLTDMIRTGFGYDVHRFAANRPLMLGGIDVPHDRGLDGHSDADVLLHAVTDALLGAAALGDIGTHFPDSDERFRGADSAELLAASLRLLADAGFEVVNVDATVVAEAPRLAPHIPRMRERMAELLRTDVDRVSVKATTSEGMGFVGDGRGMAAYAVCLIRSAEQARDG